MQGIPSSYLAVHHARWFRIMGYMEQARETKHTKPTNAANVPTLTSWTAQYQHLSLLLQQHTYEIHFQ